MTDLLTTVALLFIISGPFLLVANQFDLPTVPFLIVGGIVAGFFVDEALTLELAQYGIALLVFSFGVGINLSSVETVLGDSELAALGQILVVGLLGVGFGLAIGIPLLEAAFIGVAAAFSSTIVGTALLETERRQNLLHTRLADSVQFVQDLVAIIVLLVLGAGTLAADPIAAQLGYGLSLLIIAGLINRHLFDAVGRLAGDSDELMIIAVVSLLVLFIAAAELAGVSIVVGAFAAGLAIRHDPVAYLGLFNGLQSIRDFFVAIFFVTIGALVVVPFVELGLTASIEKLVIAAGLVVLTAVVKPLVTIAVLVYKGYEPRSATLTSLSIDQISEFALIIAIEALILGILTQNVFDAIILATAITMITSSLTQRHNERLYRILADRGLLSTTHRKVDSLSRVPDELTDHVVIVGYGRKGQLLVEACKQHDQPYIIIENDPARLDDLSANAEAYVFGDAMERYTWEKATVSEAKLVISAVNSHPVSHRLLEFDFEPDLILRSDSVSRAFEYLDRGALHVNVSDLLAGEQLVSYLSALFDEGISPAELREERMEQLERYAEKIDQRSISESISRL